MEKNYIVFVALLSLLLVSGCLSNNEPTVACGGSDYMVQAGDYVTVDYTGSYANGEVFDSGTIDFNVSAGEVIPGFDKAVLGMCLFENKSVVIPPEEGYGEHQDDLVLVVPTTFLRNRTIEVSMQTFTDKFIYQPAVGNVYTDASLTFPLKVTQVVDDNVVMERIADVGEVIPAGNSTEPWPLEVVAVNDTDITLLRKVTNGEVFDTYAGPKVATVANGSIIIDLNSPLAGKTLYFDIKVMGLQ